MYNVHSCPMRVRWIFVQTHRNSSNKNDANFSTICNLITINNLTILWSHIHMLFFCCHYHFHFFFHIGITIVRASFIKFWQVTDCIWTFSSPKNQNPTKKKWSLSCDVVILLTRQYTWCGRNVTIFFFENIKRWIASLTFGQSSILDSPAFWTVQHFGQSSKMEHKTKFVYNTLKN